MFVLVDAILLCLTLQKKDIGKISSLKFLHFHLTILHHISKIWECVLQFWFILILAMCVKGEFTKMVNTKTEFKGKYISERVL